MRFDLLEQSLFGNPLREYLLCIGILTLGLLFKRFGAAIISRQSFRIIKGFSNNEFSEEFVALERKPFEQLITLCILYLAFDRLFFPDDWHLDSSHKIGLRWFISTGYQVALYVVVTRILLRATDFFSFVLQNREDAPMSRELAEFLKELLKVAIVIMLVFCGLRFIFSVNITALVASLGIGGLAVALAAQDTLSNLLASFIIYLDKPFHAGDQVETGDVKGTVMHVGFRTTRIRTVEKTMLTVPNRKMIDSALNNISLAELKRVRTVLGLTYDSRPEQIKAIIEQIRTMIVEHPDTTGQCVVHFTDMDTSSLNIMVVYFVQGNDDDRMMEVREQMNFRLMEIVERNGCAFAYPTQTLHVQKTDSAKA